MRLIDADELIEKFEPKHYQDWYTPWIIARIKDAPTVEAKPVVHGKWEYSKEYIICSCSVCGEIPDCFEPNFCPNCGADMRKKVE